jgi:hypothetical protein
MFQLFKSDKPGLGLVFFEQVTPSAAKMTARLEAAGMEVAPARDTGKLGKPGGQNEWAFDLRHPQHGQAMAVFKQGGPPAAAFLEFGFGLTKAEVGRAATAREAAMVVVPAELKHVLRDRKRLLRFMRALMGDDGVLAVDIGSGMPWSPAALDDELAHDAELDPEALYVFHAVQEGDEKKKDAPIGWLHTHGLGELGGFDVDLLRPNELVVERANDVFRALAFAMLEGKLTESTAAFELIIPNGTVRLVPAAEFMRDASPKDRALRDMGPDTNDAHTKSRVVVCEPGGKGLLRSGKPEPSRILSSGFNDDTMLAFTTAGTELMAERARGTVSVFASLAGEFAELPVNPLVKLGFPTSQPGSNEHLWFVVHSVEPGAGGSGGSPGTVDCTLVNEPFDVAGLREGQRGPQSLDRLTDWTITSPAGWITPRSLRAARVLRSLPPEARAELIELKRKEEK